MEPQRRLAQCHPVHGAVRRRHVPGRPPCGPRGRSEGAGLGGAGLGARARLHELRREPVGGAVPLRRRVRAGQRRHLDHAHRRAAQPLVSAAHGHGQQHRDLRHGPRPAAGHLAARRAARRARLARVLPRARHCDAGMRAAAAALRAERPRPRAGSAAAGRCVPDRRTAGKGGGDASRGAGLAPAPAASRHLCNLRLPGFPDRRPCGRLCGR